MRILIIGGTGFIGQHIVHQIADQGHEVTIFHRGRTTAVLHGVVREIVDPSPEEEVIFKTLRSGR